MSRKGRALQYFVGTLTQGVADAFVQLAIATALSGQNKVCYRMASLEIEWPRFVQVDQSNMEFGLTRKSFAAMPGMLEKSLIFRRMRQTMLATAVGFQTMQRTEVVTWSDDDAPVIVEDPIYAQLDTAASALVNVLTFRIGYWTDTISEVDKLTLVANSLS